MGTLGETGVPVTVDPVWRRLAQASSPAIHGTLPYGTNHQGKNNLLLFPAEKDKRTRVQPPIRCKERLGGLLKYYHRGAA